MRIVAIRVIRSATLDGNIYVPGDEAEVLQSFTDITGRVLLRVVWDRNRLSCVVLQEDVQIISDATLPAVVEPSQIVAPPATAPRDAQSEPASCSPVQLHPVRQLGGLAEEPVGTFGQLATLGNGGGI